MAALQVSSSLICLVSGRKSSKTPASICGCLNCLLFKRCFLVPLNVRCKEARNAMASFVRIDLASCEIGPRISTPGTGDTIKLLEPMSHDKGCQLLAYVYIWAMTALIVGGRSSRKNSMIANPSESVQRGDYICRSVCSLVLHHSMCERPTVVRAESITCGTIDPSSNHEAGPS